MINMKKVHFLALFITSVAGLMLISGCTQDQVALAPCQWVFKTNGDYSNLVSVLLTQDKTEIAVYPFFSGIEKLDQGYYLSVSGCAYDEGIFEGTNIAFTSITMDQWNQAQEDCYQQMAEKHTQLKIQKCGSLDFDMFEECLISENEEIDMEPECSITAPPIGVEIPTVCSYNYTSDELDSSCEPTYSAIDLLNNIVDDDPLTELYFCDSREDPSSLIKNNELASKCTRKI